MSRHVEPKDEAEVDANSSFNINILKKLVLESKSKVGDNRFLPDKISSFDGMFEDYV